MQPKSFQVHHLVKSEDLNHHGTLFAGRGAEWFVEAGFISAANLLDPKHLVCKVIHGLNFLHPVRLGDIICFTSKVVYTGRTSLTTHVSVSVNRSECSLLDGFITFIHVDDQTRALPHHIEINPSADEDRKLYEIAASLRA